ncbi:MAG: chemotaxis-specific protein-glutamate methyltransferase CheB [Chloroflexi bacterium]|nr:chemotaxis-specific protein-glutamate methyltransferase CheB [Chloroflexota bacterium]
MIGTSRRKNPIRVLVVEDSPTARNLLVLLFQASGDIEVVGTALDGKEAVRRAAELRPDVITMDIQLPGMNGLQATREIMRLTPVPIVVVTATLDQPDMDLTFEAMRAGALSVVKKPARNDVKSCEQVVNTVRLMADVPVVHRWHPGDETALHKQDWAITAKLVGVDKSNLPYEAGRSNKRIRLVGIAASTGGPGALLNVFKGLPADFPVPIVVVQHITIDFAQSLAKWLDGQVALQVRLAEQNEIPQPGSVLIAPDDHHLEIGARGEIVLNSRPPNKGLRPSADYLFSSMASVYGAQAVGVILTGMGNDGVDGLCELHQRGGMVLAQDEETSVVYGMPREAAMKQIVDRILPIYQIGPYLRNLLRIGD